MTESDPFDEFVSLRLLGIVSADAEAGKLGTGGASARLSRSADDERRGDESEYSDELRSAGSGALGSR